MDCLVIMIFGNLIMHEYFFLLSVFGLVLPIIIVSQIINENREKARTEKLHPVAQALGFQFFPKPAPTYLQLIYKFSLFKFGQMKRICNLMEIQQPSLEIMIFDYLYYSGKFEHKQTVICFHLHQKRFPIFYVQPRMSPYKAERWFIQHEVSFAQDRLFSKQYVVCGRDETAIQALFTNNLREFLKQNPGANLQVADGYLIYFRPRVWVAPEKIFAFLDEGLTVLNLCLDAVKQPENLPKPVSLEI